MLCVSQGAVWLILVVVFRFRKKGVKLSRGGVSFKLAVPGGCIEFRKPASELGQVQGIEGFDSLLQGFHIGHGLLSDSPPISLTRTAWRRPPQTANAITGNHAAGISRSSRQRIAIGRSPSWLS